MCWCVYTCLCCVDVCIRACGVLMCVNGRVGVCTCACGVLMCVNVRVLWVGVCIHVRACVVLV